MMACGPSLEDRLGELVVAKDTWAARAGDRHYTYNLTIGANASYAISVTNPGLLTYNLGTGRGYSVLEMVHAFAEAADKNIPYRIVERRPGDIASCYADPSKAERELSWKAVQDINAMCIDTWRWQTKNPNGYE